MVASKLAPSRQHREEFDNVTEKYGVLKGTVIGHLRNAHDDHYQILVKARRTVYRIAVNVKSTAPKSPSTRLFIWYLDISGRKDIDLFLCVPVPNVRH